MKNLIIILGLATLSSCSSHRLVGNWNVEKYETSTPGSQATSLSNIGTMTFKKNNTGEKNLNYQVLGIQRNDVLPFTWNATDNYVTISGNSSEFAKTWIILENKRKFQKWKSTDGTNQVQTLELKK